MLGLFERYIKNIIQIDNTIHFDLVYLKTPSGLKYSKMDDVHFDIMFSNNYIELTTSGSYQNGAVLRTDSKTLIIRNFFININDKNRLKILNFR